MLISVSASAQLALNPHPRIPLPKLDCAGCRKCCEGDQIILEPSDDASLWQTEKLPGGALALARAATGNCVYLGAGGCTLHAQRRPAKCERFDCRVYYLLLEHNPAALASRLAASQNGPVVREGRRRVAAVRRGISHV